MAKFIISLSVALLILAGIGVAAITQIETADTSGWNPTTVTTFGFLGVVSVLGVMVAVLRKAGLFSGSED